MNKLDDPAQFDLLTTEQQDTIETWILSNLRPRKTLNKRYTSYGLKDIFERSPNGFPLSNGEFKGAMLACGYMWKECDEKNWIFNVSKQSPILRNNFS